MLLQSLVTVTFENDKGKLRKESFCPPLDSNVEGKQYHPWRPGLMATVRVPCDTRIKTKEALTHHLSGINRPLKHKNVSVFSGLGDGVLARSA